MAGLEVILGKYRKTMRNPPPAQRLGGEARAMPQAPPQESNRQPEQLRRASSATARVLAASLKVTSRETDPTPVYRCAGAKSAPLNRPGDTARLLAPELRTGQAAV